MSLTLHQRATLHEAPEFNCPVCGGGTDHGESEKDGHCGGRCMGCDELFCSEGYAKKYCEGCVSWAKANPTEAVEELLAQIAVKA